MCASNIELNGHFLPHYLTLKKIEQNLSFRLDEMLATINVNAKLESLAT
jgi:hypothetical protein